MYYQLFNELRAEIGNHYGLQFDPESGELTPCSEPDAPVKDIQLLNNQFEKNSISVVPLVLIGFSDLEFSPETKDSYLSPIEIEILFISSKISMSDGQPHDTDVQNHEAVARQIVELIHGYKFENTAKGVYLKSYKANMDIGGYAVTSMTFTSKVKL